VCRKTGATVMIKLLDLLMRPPEERRPDVTWRSLPPRMGIRSHARPPVLAGHMGADPR
jgi:hypothetical protein